MEKENLSKKRFWETLWNSRGKKFLLVSSALTIVSRVFEKFLEELILDRISGWGNDLIDRGISAIPENILRDYIDIVLSWILAGLYPFGTLRQVQVEREKR